MDLSIADIGSDNRTDNSSVDYIDYDDPFLRAPLKPILIATFIPLFIMGLMGNLLVIYVIARNRSMQTVTNFFLANLAVADLLVSLCCVIPKLLWFILESWTFGSFLCRMHLTMISLTTNASIFILTVISAERFIAIVYPFETKQILTSKRLFIAIVGVWCLSAILSCPTAVTHDVISFGSNLYCGSSTSLFIARIHTVVLFFICFLIPLITMGMLYIKISRRLWTRNRAGKLGMVSRNNYNFTRKPSVDAVIERAGVGVFHNTDSPVVNRTAKHACIDEVTSFIPKTSDYASDQNIVNIETCHPQPGTDNYCVKIGPFFLDEPEEDIEPPIQSIEGVSHRWSLCKDPPMGLAKIDLKHVKFGFDNNQVKKVQSLLTTESDDSLDSLGARPNGRYVHKTVSDPITNTSRCMVQSSRIKLTHTTSFDSPYRDRDSPIVSVSGSNASTSIGSKIARRKKQKTAKAVMTARKKVIRLLIIMLVAFALCLFPMQLLGFWFNFGTYPNHTLAGRLLIPFAFAAYFFNSALNPFLYAFLSDNFRSKMRETLCIPKKTKRDVRHKNKRVRNVPSEAYTESDWTHSLHLTTDASLHQL